METDKGCQDSSNALVLVNSIPTASITPLSATTFCSGDSLILAANPRLPGTSYLWSDGSQLDSLVVTSSGVYSVIVTNTNGCSSKSNKIQITVNPLPEMSSILGPSSVCYGDSILLTNGTVKENGWKSWWRINDFDRNSEIDSLSGWLTGTDNFGGLDSVSYVVETDKGCIDSSLAYVNVNSSPILNPLTICEGTQAAMNTQAPNGLWISHNQVVATVDINGNVYGQQAGNSIVTYIDPITSCKDTALVTISILPKLILNSNISSLNQDVCLNSPLSEIEFHVEGVGINPSMSTFMPQGVYYSYNPTNGLLVISGTPVQNGGLFSFVVETTGGSCTQAIDTIKINVHQPTIQLSSNSFTNNQTVCSNQSIEQIEYLVSDTASIQGLPSGVSGIYQPGIPNKFIIQGMPLIQGTYYYSLNLYGICNTTEAIGQINAVAPITGHISGSDITICDGSDFDLNASILSGPSSNMTFQWQYSSNPNGPYIAAPGINSTAIYSGSMSAGDTMNYFRRIVNVGSCFDTAFYVVVKADSLPQIISVGDTAVCSNDTVSISSILISNGVISSWSSNGLGFLDPSDMNHPIYYSNYLDGGKSIQLSFVVTSDNACAPYSVNGLYQIDVRDNPQAQVGGSAYVCGYQNMATITGASSSNGVFGWYHNGFGFLTETESLSPIYHTDIKDTGSIVSVLLTVNTGSECSNPLIDTALFEVVLAPLGINPDINAFAGEDLTISLGDSIQLNASGVAITTWNWSPSAGLSDTTVSNPIAKPIETTTYVLNVIDLHGCIDRDTMIITVVKDYQFNIPNLISPNGDASNDFLEIPGIELYPNTHVTIFNREGKVVYDNENYDNSWDATFNGNPLPEATYYYLIEFIESDQKYRGAITVIRNKK